MDEQYYQLQTIGEKISYLKDNGLELPDIEKYNSEWDEKRHKIMTDRVAYPDPILEDEYTDEFGKKQTRKVPKKLVRVPLAYQKRLVSIGVTFLFGNEVKYTNNLEDSTLYDAYIKVKDKEKFQFLDREIAESNCRWKQCAELWWTAEESNTYYDFQSQFRLKVTLLTPDKNKLYPYFNDQGDMIAFLREYEKKVNGQKVKHYDIYTADRIAQLREGNGGYMLISESANPVGKIPIVFYSFPEVEWERSQPAIERLEEIQSGTGETNKKFADPILGLTGEVTGSISNNTGGKVFQFKGENAGGQYIQPPNASENLATEKKSLQSIVYEMSNSIDISPEAFEGMGNMLATENAAYLFMAPHLKVEEKTKVYIPALQRRMSIVKSFLQLMNTSFRGKDLDAKPIITPYIINNEAKFLEMLMSINGGKPLYSQRATMEKAGIKDPDKMQAEINKENPAPPKTAVPQ